MGQCFFWGRNILFHELKITDETWGYRPDGVANFRSQEHILTGIHTLITVKKWDVRNQSGLRTAIHLFGGKLKAALNSIRKFVSKEKVLYIWSCSQITIQPFEEELPWRGDDIAHGKKHRKCVLPGGIIIKISVFFYFASHVDNDKSEKYVQE